MGHKLSNPTSASVSGDRTGSRGMVIFGVLLALCAMVVFLASDRPGSSRKPSTQRQTPSPSFAASENGNEKSSHPLRQREAKSQEPRGKPPQAFLGGATSLNDDASAYLGVSKEQANEISRALTDARDAMTHLALSKIAEVPVDQAAIDYSALGFSIDPNAGGVSPENAKTMIAASYAIPAMPEKGTQIKDDLRARLKSVMGDAGATVADEAEQHSELLDFGKSDISLLLLKNKQGSGYSVYMESRVPGTGKLKGGCLLPLAAFNKRSGQFFEIPEHDTGRN